MRYSRLRLLLFTVVSGAIIVFLAWYSPLTLSKNRVDRHTGEEIDEDGIAVSRQMGATAEEVLDGARELGDARLALAHIRVNKQDVRNPAGLLKATNALTAELAPVEELVEAARKDAEQVWVRYEAARIRLTSAPEHPPRLEEVLIALRALALADGSGEAIEAFFLPFGKEWDAGEDTADAVERFAASDRVTAVAISRADGQVAEVSAEECLLLARSFRSAARPRARFRWLIRAFEKEPSSPHVALAAAGAYLEHGRQLEALSILVAAAEAGADSDDVWRTLAQVAAWTAAVETEAKALERVFARDGDEAKRDRLLSIYRHLGRPEYALPHVLARAEAEGTPEALDLAVRAALEASDVDTALDLVRRAAERAEDPRPWRDRLVTLYLEDLRLDSAIAELKALHEEWPDGGYGVRLEKLLRRRGGGGARAEPLQPGPKAPVVLKSADEELADLLVKRLERKADPRLEEEVITLCSSLGQMARVRKLMLQRVRRVEDPTAFFLQLPLFMAMGVPELPEIATERVKSPLLAREEVGIVLEALYEPALEPEFRKAVEALARRYPAHPAILAFQLDLQDRLGDPEDVAAAAEALARLHPKDERVLSAWIDRATWAGLPESEMRARRAWLGGHPDDSDNRRELAELLTHLERYEEAVEQWQWLAERDGRGSASEESLFEALRASGREDEELLILAERIDLPGLTHEERSRLASRFYVAQWMELSLVLYLTILEEDPDDLIALLRVGQIRAAGNDPYGALPLFERVLELAGPGDGEILYQLGESYWACGREDDAIEAHAAALPLLGEESALTVGRQGMVARILARFGREAEALEIFERLLALEPDNVDLRLDYADALLAQKRTERAKGVLATAAGAEPDDRRVLRVAGQVALQEGRLEDAVASLLRSRELHGPDAGLYADLGEALVRLERTSEAEEAYDRSLELQPGSVTTAWVRRKVHDRLASPVAETELVLRWLGDDRATELRQEGACLLDDERTRLSASLDWISHRGRAWVVDRAKSDVAANFGAVSAALWRRFGRGWEAGGGPDIYLDRPDAAPFGLWFEGRRGFTEPPATVGLRLHVNEPLRDPIAAAALGGSSHGIEADGFLSEEGAWWWLSGQLGYRRISYDHPRSGRPADGQLRAELVAGARIRERGPHVSERTVAGEPPGGEGYRISAWLSYNPTRLLDDRELSGPLPVGDRFDYLTATARVEGRVGRGVFFEAEGYVGTDFADPGLISGGVLGLAWRPRDGLEVRAQGAYGHAIGREEDEGAGSFSLGLTLSW
ncbi:MAG: tetratricopeptide repeat protein [Planctomycetota bacterium]